MTNITILPATKDQLTQLHAILVECSIWLKKKKINQWQPVYHKSRFTQEVLKNYVYACFTERKLIGTVTLLPHKPDYYPFGIWNNDTSALYICRLAIMREYVHRTYGKEIIYMIEQLAKDQGIAALRLDITPHNNFLKEYYLSLGFVQRFSHLDLRESFFFEKVVV